MKFLRQSLTGLFLMALTVGLLAIAGNLVVGAAQKVQSRQAGRPPARERVFAVDVVDARPQRITPILTAFGEVTTTRTLEIRATAGGRLVYLAPEFRDGGQVRAGQLLARVEQVEAQSQLERVNANMLDAEAELRDATRALELAGDDLAAMQEQADLRAKALARQIDLRDRGVGTEAAVEQAELAVSAARAAVLGKRQALANAQARADQAQTRLARQKISLADARRALAETEIAAGFTGSLGDVTAVEGGLVSKNEKLGQLIDPDNLEVSFRISTAQYVRLLGADGNILKAPVQVRLDVGGIALVSAGQIDRDSAAVGDGQTGRLVYARIDSVRGLKPGDFVTVNVQEPPIDGVIRLPAAAYGSDGAVLVVDDTGHLQSVPVDLVRRQGDDVLVKADGLAGQRVVAARTPLLGAGIGVRVLNRNGGETNAANATSGEGAQPAVQTGPRGGPDQRPGAAADSGDMITLDDARREKLRNAVNANTRMPADAKQRILELLDQPQVPRATVERLESRIRN